MAADHQEVMLRVSAQLKAGPSDLCIPEVRALEKAIVPRDPCLGKRQCPGDKVIPCMVASQSCSALSHNGLPSHPPDRPFPRRHSAVPMDQQAPHAPA